MRIFAPTRMLFVDEYFLAMCFSDKFLYIIDYTQHMHVFYYKVFRSILQFHHILYIIE